MTISATELEAWAGLLGVPGRARWETEAGFRARLLRVRRREPRVCIREDFEDYAAAGCISLYRIKKWTYQYSDGTEETLKIRYRK